MITMQEEEPKNKEELAVMKDPEEEKDQVWLIKNSYLSLHALEGTFNYETMRIRGSVGRKMLCVLIDTRSTHNFINANVAMKMGCIMEPIPELKVSAANGEELRCKEVCRAFTWVMQGQLFTAEVLSLFLGNYDLVLGIQWLVELRDILWNFK